MCGIIAVIGFSKTYNMILEGLKQLQNRGYDSAGMCLFSKLNKNMLIKKFVSDDVSAIHKMELNNIKDDFFSGMGHTRWATHGKINEINCHPHNSCDNKISVVHNGIIENYKEIKEFLIKENYNFYSETDSEVISNLISYFRKKNSMIISLKKTSKLLTGTWGIVIMEEGNDKMYFTRQGSPLLLGFTQNRKSAVITSEKSGFNSNIVDYISIQNNDICYLETNEGFIEFFSEKTLLNFDNEYYEYDKLLSEQNIEYNYIYKTSTEMRLHSEKMYKKIHNKKVDHEDSPGEFIYWTLKEIEEQTKSSLSSINMGGRLKDNIHLGGLNSEKDNLKLIDNLFILGCGTSYNAGLFISSYFKKYCNFNFISVLDGADFNNFEIPKRGKTGCIFLSQSGETLDLIRCIDICKTNNIITIGIVNVVDSTISRETDCGCYLNAGREVGVASTKAFTSQIIVLLLTCLWFSKLHYGHLSEECLLISKELHVLSDKISSIIYYSKDIMNKWSQSMMNEKSIFVLGKDECYAIAREASLKIKEISYIHAESSPASALKHGPFGLLEKNFHVILVDIGNDNRSKMENVYNEIYCRGAKVYTITDNQQCQRDNCFILNTNSKLNNMLSIIPLQYLSFYLSINKNINPDYPRNLAKVVTVE